MESESSTDHFIVILNTINNRVQIDIILFTIINNILTKLFVVKTYTIISPPRYLSTPAFFNISSVRALFVH
jgi:hypothetical protein